MFSGLPRQAVNLYLNEARRDRVRYELLTAMEPAWELVESATFHLYDKEVWKLLREFFSQLDQADALAGGLFHDYRHNGVATLRDTSSPELREEYKRFHEHIEQARHAFSMLNSYVREQFPELDLEETDRSSYRAYREAVAEAERKIAEMVNGDGEPDLGGSNPEVLPEEPSRETT